MNGHLVIADISGYTRFLTESELEHANGILEELLNAIISAINAPLTLSSIEGDAVLLYGEMPEGTIGQAVVDSVERLYTAFASALETMVLNTTCQCNACVNIKGLGLKIVMHCGEFAVSKMGGRETLTGPDVIVVHRLLKNTIIETTGISDYLFVTDRCVADLGIEAIVAGWTPHTEEYEHVGRVSGHVSSLKDVWEFRRSQTEDKVREGEAWFTVQAHTPAPIGVVWDHMLDPVKRTRWIDANDSELIGTEGGRIGPGTEYHCAHGPNNDIAVIAIVDMKVHEYVTQTAPIGPGIGFKWTDYLVPSGDGARVISVAAPPFEVDTGLVVPEEGLGFGLDAMSQTYQNQVDRLASMAAAASSS
ncbi:MAG: DUF2652 domain-containing protein [Acidimicrobiia bacterium]